MAPKGPILPRKDTALLRARQSLESVAFQIGVIVAIQRNRWQLTQTDLGQQVGLTHNQVSRVENGYPIGSGVANKKIDALFEYLELPADGAHANYVKWWRDNSTL